MRLEEYLAPPQRKLGLAGKDWTGNSCNYILRFRRYILEGDPIYGVDRRYMQGYIDAILQKRPREAVFAALHSLHSQEGWAKYCEEALADLYPAYAMKFDERGMAWVLNSNYGEPLFELAAEHDDEFSDALPKPPLGENPWN